MLYQNNRSELYYATQKFGGLRRLNETFSLGLNVQQTNIWTDDKIIEELRLIAAEGYPLTYKTLRKLNRYDLHGALSKRGALNDIKEKMGLQVKKKTIWTKESIIRAYNELFSQLGRIPSVKDIRESSYRDLEYGIYAEFKKITNLRKEMQLHTNRKPPAWWTLENTVKELKQFHAENTALFQHKAVSPLLFEKGRSDIFNAAQKFGGIRKLCEAYLGMKFPSSTDWTEDSLLEELKTIYGSEHAISDNILRKLNRHDLIGAMKKYGTLNDFKEKMGLTVKRQTHWTQEKVHEEYNLIRQKTGKHPTTQKLIEMGKSELIYGIKKYYGNIKNYRKEHNITETRKPQHYWTRENVIKELKEFIDSHPDYNGNCSPQMFTDHNRDDLRRAIYKFGGIRVLSKDSGLNLTIKHKSWSEQELLDELIRLSTSNIPITQKSLLKLKRSDLLGAAEKFEGLNAVKQKMGLQIKRQSYWTNEIIIEQLKPLIKEYGRIPSEAVFNCLGKKDLFSAIQKKGGIKKFAQHFDTISEGYYQANDGHYLQSGYECIFDNILHKYNIPHEVHGKISGSHNYRYDFLVNGTYIEICGYNKKEHPRYHQRLRTKLRLYKEIQLNCLVIPKKIFGKNIIKLEEYIVDLIKKITVIDSDITTAADNITGLRPVTYWAGLENIRTALMPLVNKYGRFPLDRELREEKQFSLLHGIYKYHGSPYELGKKLNIEVKYKPKGFYTEENAIAEYKELCEKSGFFLSQGELHAKSLHGLNAYITKNGGIFKFRENTGLQFPNRKLPAGYYTPEKAQDEYKKLCLEKGCYISSKGLKALNAASLADYIQKTGGYPKIRKAIGLKFPQLRKPVNFWTEEITMAEYKKFVKALKRKPALSDFIDSNRQDLLGALNKFGGLSKANKLWGNFKQ